MSHTGRGLSDSDGGKWGRLAALGLSPLEDLIRKVESPRENRYQKRTVPERRSTLAARAQRAIEVGFASINIQGQLASALGCHPVHLSRSFKAEFGITVSEYVRALRLREGVRLLVESDVKVTTVPLMVGFRGKSAFYHAIRTITGDSPGAFRNRLKTGVSLLLAVTIAA
jgi:methylphosphotriester-DNA--protein-cysteine methyltransferase